MRTHCSFIALLWVALSSSVAASEPSETAGIAPVCSEHITRDGKFAITELPKLSGEYSETVVIAYKLDGSGKAAQAQVTQSSKRRQFDPLALKVLERAEFSPGVSADNCVYVRSFSRVRRREI